MSVFAVFVHNPASLALISGLFFAAYVLVRGNPRLRSQALLAPATAWLAWATWEWIVMTFSPEANIRVDLLLIIPLVLLVSAMGVVGVFLRRGALGEPH